MNIKLQPYEVQEAIRTYINKELKADIDIDAYFEIYIRGREQKKTKKGENKETEMFLIPNQFRDGDELEVFIDTTDYSGGE